MLVDVFLVVGELLFELGEDFVFFVSKSFARFGALADQIHGNVVATNAIDHFHVEWSGSGALFFVAVDSEAVGSGVGPEDLLDVVDVAVVAEYDWLVLGEVVVESGFSGAAAWFGAEVAEADGGEFGDVYVADAEFWNQVFTKLYGKKGFLGDVVSGRGEDDVWFSRGAFAAGPVPDCQTVFGLGAGFFEAKPLWEVAFSSNYYTYCVFFVHNFFKSGEHAVGIRRVVDLAEFTVFLENIGNEGRVLVRIAVVILAPADAGLEVDGGANRFAPRYLEGLFHKFGVLVDHAGDDGGEGFVADENAVASSEQVALVPTLEGVFGEHFHGAAVGAQVLVAVGSGPHVGAVGLFKNGCELVGF